jgi:argininosuccinate synthase
MPKCVLAFSGSLETLIAIPWLKEHGYDVVTLSVNLGGEPELEELGERALIAGAGAARIEDLRDTFFSDFVGPQLRALGHYETYLLCTALARPLIARELVRVALEEGATHVAHCSSIQGNDQVRFQNAFGALSPQLKIVSPQHEWDLRSDEQRISFAKTRRLQVPPMSRTALKYDKNLWGQSIKCQSFDDPSHTPAEEVYTLTKPLLKAPDVPQELQIEFKAGHPVGLDGKRTSPATLIEKLNQIAGSHGIGRADLIEDRVVGFKSREIYEAPAATVLYVAKRALEQMTLSRESLQVREGLAVAYGRLVYNGQWFCDLREALDAFFARINQSVSGSVTVRLYKGNTTVISRSSDFSLYSTPDKSGIDHETARGLIKVMSLPLNLEARRKKAES